MRTNLFFILVALLILGYLHLLAVYVQRINLNFFHQEKQAGRAYQRQYQGLKPATGPTYDRLTEIDARRHLAQAPQRVPSLIHSVQGNPIPNWDDVLKMGISNPQVRSERILYVITPTYERITQLLDLTRLKQTLMLASLQHRAKIYWILIEDAEECSQRVRAIAGESGLAYAHTAIKQQPGSDQQGHRGVMQRNLGLETVLEVGKEGVIYFADDDNGYDVQLFSELLYTRHTSIFAVGLSGGSAYERCHVNNRTGKVDAILTSWVPRYRVPIRNKPGKFTRPQRKYGIDMAGFALSTTALRTNQARFLTDSTSGMLETDFLSQLVNNMSELEPLAANCTRILVWHVKTTEPQYFNNPEKDEASFKLLKQLV